MITHRVTLHILSDGDGFMLGASTNENANKLSYWVVAFDDVPKLKIESALLYLTRDELDQFLSHGTLQQHYIDGYEAMRAFRKMVTEVTRRSAWFPSEQAAMLIHDAAVAEEEIDIDELDVRRD